MSMRVSYCVERHCDCLLPFPKEAAICPIPILPDGVTRQSQSNVSCGPMLYFSESFEMIGMAETKAGRAIGSLRIPEPSVSSQMMPRVALRARTPRMNAFSTMKCRNGYYSQLVFEMEGSHIDRVPVS